MGSSDITERAIATLKSVARIAAEDTRHAQHLLTHYHIQKPLLSLHQFNEHERINTILSFLDQGDDIALISDAGTPLISDPGYPLIKAIRENHGTIIPIPGPCALITALCASGLSTSRFIFEGFLPAKSSHRKTILTSLLKETRTIVFYEAPHRIIETVMDIKETLGDQRQLVIARELTKLFEEFISGVATDIITHFEKHPDTKRGEMVILLEGVKEEEEDETRSIETEKILTILLEELPTKQAVNLASKITGERKNKLYDFAINHSKSED